MEAGDQRGKVRVWVTFQVTCALWCCLSSLAPFPPAGWDSRGSATLPLHTGHGNYWLGSHSPARWGQRGMPWGCPSEQCPTADQARRGLFGFAAFLLVEVTFCPFLPP